VMTEDDKLERDYAENPDSPVYDRLLPRED
jgi:hypothetical protein